MLEFEGPVPGVVVPGYGVVVIGVLVDGRVCGHGGSGGWSGGKGLVGVGGGSWNGDGDGAGNVCRAVLAEVLSA